MGSRIKEIREARGLSQAELAAEVSRRGVPGIYPQTITKIETGSRALKFSEGMVIARVLRVTPADLAGAETWDPVQGALYKLNVAAKGAKDASIEASSALAVFLTKIDELKAEIAVAASSGLLDSRIHYAQEIAAEDLNSVIRRARAVLLSERARADAFDKAMTEGDDGEHQEAF